jgi:hypothetical protein
MKRTLIILILLYLVFRKETKVKVEVKQAPVYSNCIDAISAGAKLSKADAG